MMGAYTQKIIKLKQKKEFFSFPYSWNKGALDAALALHVGMG